MRSMLVAVALSMAVLLAPTAAAAAGPTAIAVDGEGYAYAAYAAGGTVERFQPSNGGKVGTFPIPAVGVAALDVGPSETVWVLDVANRLSEYSKYGNPLRTIAIGQCTVTGDPLARGGVVVTASQIWVASACSDKVFRLGTDLSVQQAFDVTQPRGIHVNGGRVWVGRRASNDVVGYNQTTFAVERTQAVGGRPGDLFVDDFGVLFAADVDNHFIRLFGSDGAEFRTLGRFGSNPGDLTTPSALDVFGQYGNDLAGNIFVADYGNQRIQRWNSFGFTFWTAQASDGGGGPVQQPPVNTNPPAISGVAQEGQVVACSQGSWTEGPTTFAFQWTRNGSDVAGATSSSYSLTAADVGAQIRCRVTASNPAGSGQATSSAITPIAAPPPSGAVVKVSINNRARYATSRNVEVWVIPPLNVQRILISDDGDFTGVTTPGTPCCFGRYAFTLPGTAPEKLPAHVYVRFEGPGIDPNQTYGDDIVLDLSAPALTRVSASAAGTATTLRVKARDRISGVRSIEVRSAGGGRTTVARYRSVVRIPKLNARLVKVRAIDGAGNRGRWKTVRVKRGR